MKELWKDIKGFKGWYMISTKGRVWNCKRGCYKVLDKNNCGYLRVQLCKRGKKERFFVHRLVAEAFLDNPLRLEQVNHKDLNKANNCVENLEWVSASQNMIHAHRAGRCTGSFKPSTWKIEYTDGRVEYVEGLKGVAEKTGTCRQTIFNRIEKSDGYMPELDAYVSHVSNDHPGKE